MLRYTNGLYDSERISLQRCKFERNHAHGSGGGIFSSCISLDMQQCAFDSNKADKEGPFCIVLADSPLHCVCIGGGLFVNASSSLTLFESTFKKNSAVLGGALAVYAEATRGNVSINSSSFSQNEASDGDGGGLYFCGSGSTVNISGSNFSANVALNNGGAVYGMQTEAVGIHNSVFKRNTAATGSGAALCVIDNREFRLQETEFSSGKAGSHGGEIYVVGSESVIIDSFNGSKSTAGIDGGFIALKRVGMLSLANSTVTSIIINEWVTCFCFCRLKVAKPNKLEAVSASNIHCPSKMRLQKHRESS